MKKILGISAFYHDSAASILIDGEVIAAAGNTGELSTGPHLHFE